jgi:hypothetical protein
MPIVIGGCARARRAGLAARVELGTLLEDLWQMNLKPVRAVSITLG